MILVCDIGGGTTDFSLITVVETPTGPGFRRVAVGDHLMLGGDNIDLALAHHVEKKLGGARLDSEQWSALRSACRTAKEKLLGEDQPGLERWPVTIAGRGSKLIGGSLQAELTRQEVEAIAVDGFFPATRRDEDSRSRARTGMQEFGLPFVADPAVPKHLSQFLRRHRAEAGVIASEPRGCGPGSGAVDRPARPDAILFNGGALTPEIVRRRIVEVITSWFADDYRARLCAPRADQHLARPGRGPGRRLLRSGAARRRHSHRRRHRTFFLRRARDERGQQKPWLCVVPRDSQEGEEITIAGHDFDLLMGQPVVFPLASSSVRPDDKPGDLVRADPDSIRELPPLQSLMRVSRKAKAERAPVSLAARVTEVGTIELWCQSRTDDRRWRLQIQLRGPAGHSMPRGSVTGDESDHVVIEQSELDAATAAIQRGVRRPARRPQRLRRLRRPRTPGRRGW